VITDRVAEQAGLLAHYPPSKNWMKNEYVYVVWFRDFEHEPEDQDYEWPACFVIRAASEEAALQWGDFLSKRHSQQNPTRQILQSHVEVADRAADPAISSLPIVEFAVDASDEHIGW
jgi:hypothetical protein